MAVKEVRGKADDIDLIFTQNSEGLWETTVPFDSGERWKYVVELYAVDYAGNGSYMTTVLFLFDPAALCWHMVPLESYYAEVLPVVYTLTTLEGYCTVAAISLYTAQSVSERYTLEEVYPCRLGGNAYG